MITYSAQINATKPEVPPIRDPALVKLFSYWRSHCMRLGRYPSRKDIDPLDLRNLLPNIWLVDVTPDGGFTYRLAGELIDETYGMSLRGKSLDKIYEYDRHKQNVLSRFSEIAEGKVRVVHWERHISEERFVTRERLVLPLSDDGQQVSGILGATLYEPYWNRLPSPNVIPVHTGFSPARQSEIVQRQDMLSHPSEGSTGARSKLPRQTSPTR